MRGLLLFTVLVVTAGVTGCLGDESDPPTSPASTPAANASDGPADEVVPTTSPTTAVSDCPDRFVRCFEASVAADPAGQVYTAPSVCGGIARASVSNLSFEHLDRPEIPPPAPPTTGAPGDCTLDVGPDGDLYFSAFYFHPDPVDPLPGHYGIHVARSEDGGDTWATNTYLSPTTNPPTPATYPDRQWLSFGDDGRVYLTFWGVDLDQAWVSVSQDRGESFGPFREMPGAIPGQPVAEGTQTLHVPWLDRNADEVKISTTTDGGETFETQTVGDVDSQYWWPDLEEGPSGSLYITWWARDGAVLVARETDDGGWSEPVVWNDGTRNATGVAPGIEVHDGVVDVVWYRHQGDQRAHVLGRAPVGSGNASAVDIQVLDQYQSERTVSHFGDMAVDPDGRGVFAWTDPDQGLLVARETGLDATNATAGS